MRKRTLVIAASLIVVLGLIAGAYFLFGNQASLEVSDNPFAGIDGGFVGEPILEQDSGAGEEVAPRLIRITSNPVSEGVVAITRISTTTVPSETASGTPELIETTKRDTEVRFLDRASGNIYRFMAHERSLVRLSNKTLPGIQQASWLPDGTRAYVRFLSNSGGTETLASFVLPESGEGGFFLEQNLAAAKAAGPNSLFTMLSGTSGSVGSLASGDGTNQRTLFTSLLSSLVVHPSGGSFFAHTKASNLLQGYGFSINTTTGGFTRILGPLRGLATLPSPDGTRLLYSFVDRGNLRLAVLDTQSRAGTSMPLATLVEKCVWAKNGLSVYCAIPTSIPQGLPDTWYQGAVTTSDRIWRIDMQARVATLIIDPSAVADVSVDGVALEVDPEEDVVLFTDRHSGNLWLYDL